MESYYNGSLGFFINTCDIHKIPDQIKFSNFEKFELSKWYPHCAESFYCPEGGIVYNIPNSLDTRYEHSLSIKDLNLISKYLKIFNANIVL